jgi:hypothetical protein
MIGVAGVVVLLLYFCGRELKRHVSVVRNALRHDLPSLVGVEIRGQSGKNFQIIRIYITERFLGSWTKLRDISCSSHEL